MSDERDPDLPESYHLRHESAEETGPRVISASDGSDIPLSALPPDLQGWLNPGRAQWEYRRRLEDAELRSQEDRARASAKTSRYGQLQHPSQRMGRGRGR